MLRRNDPDRDDFQFQGPLDSLSPIVFPTIAIACSDSTSDAPGRRAGAYRRPDRNATSCNRRTPLCGPIRGRGTCRSDSATRPRNCPGKYSPDGNWPGWRYSPKSPRPPGSRQPKPRRRTGRNRPAPRLRNRPESLRRRNSSRCVPPYGYAL